MRPIITAVLIFASIQSFDCDSGIIINSRLNYFDIDLLRYVAEGKSGNVMVSPASVKSMLALLLQGARGATAAEIQLALRLSPNEDDYRQQLRVFMKDLRVNTPSVSVQNANGLFVSKKLPLKKEYEMMAKNLFYSEVNNLDFNDPITAADSINGWANTNTKGLIPKIIDPAQISPQSELVVTNALYFKGIWLNKFESRPADCFFKDNVCRKVPMMELDAELRYAYVDNLRAHALELPYEGKRYSMILLVPSDRNAGVALIRDLPYIGLLEISSYLQPADVILTMPKFTVDFGDDLAGALKNMQITTLFSPSANLSGIFQDPRASGQLTSVYHKVYMQVDEQGTVAAAASAGQVVPLINSFVNLRVDRPFLFFIWDNEKGVVLFEGKIEEPTEVVGVSNKPANNGPENVKPFADPIEFELPSGEKVYNYIPIYQLRPIKPIVVQNVTSQSIQSANQPISVQPFINQSGDSQPNQPIQPVDQPITPADQLIQPADQPIQPADKPIQPVEQPIEPADQLIQPANQPIQPGDKPIQPADQLIQPADQPTPPADKPIQPVDQPIQPADKPIQPVDQPNKRADQPIQLAEQPIQSLDLSIQPADQQIQPANQLFQLVDQPIQPVDQPNQPADKPIQPVDQLIQPADKPVQPAGQPIQPADLPIQPADQPIKKIDKLIQPADKPIKPDDQPIQSADQPIQPTKNPILPEDQSIQPGEKPIKPADQLIQPADQPTPPADKPIQSVDQPIQPADKPIHPVDQPIKRADQPIQLAEQPIQLAEQPIQSLDLSIQPVDQQIQPANQLFQLADQPFQAADELIQPANQQFQTAGQLIQPANEPFHQPYQLIPPANQLIPPPEQPIQSAKQPFQPTYQSIQSQLIAEAHKKYQPGWHRRGYYGYYG